MAHTEVRVSLQGEAFVPSTPQVPIIAGDNVTFFADSYTQTKLCLDAGTASVLSPTPPLTVIIAAGSSVTFEFRAAAPGDYCVLTQGVDWRCPGSISCGYSGSSAVLVIRPGSQEPFSGPDDDTKTSVGN